MLSSLVARRLQRNDEVEQARAAGVTLKNRNGQPRRTVGARTINMTLDIVSRILADAVKRGLLPTNPAADPELRLKVTQRRGNFLEADELLVATARPPARSISRSPRERSNAQTGLASFGPAGEHGQRSPKRSGSRRAPRSGSPDAR